MITKIIAKLIPDRLKKILRNFSILAFDYGQLKTIKSGCCIDKNNQKIPWYTYPAVEYLQSLDLTGRSVLEYGCGNSSFFWSRKAGKVVSVEHDRVWYEKILPTLESNMQLIFSADGPGYENPAEISGKKFDVIIIDANRRPECAHVVDRYLDQQHPEGFMIILDNSDWFKNTADYLRQKFDMIQVDFHGFGPINNHTWTTSVLFSRNFRTKPAELHLPAFSIASLRDNCD